MAQKLLGPLAQPGHPDHPVDTRTDEALLALVVEREQTALAALYDRYGGRVFALAFRLLGDRSVAEEVTQDVFLRIWQRADLFHPGGASFLAWLLAITRNRSIDELRSRRGEARRRESTALDHPPASDAADLERRAEERALTDDIRRALNELPPSQRRAVELAVFAAMTHSEIAAMLGAPLGTVKSWLRQGMRRLRLALGQDWPGRG
jgi:RNA polymerase sigma-70 factor (ECF subfamily)